MFGPTLDQNLLGSPDCPVVRVCQIAGCGRLNNDAPLNSIGSDALLLGDLNRLADNFRIFQNKYQPAKCVGRPAKCVEQPARAAAKLLRIEIEPPLLKSSRKPRPEGQWREEEDFGFVFRGSQFGSGSRGLATLRLRAFHSSLVQVRPKKAAGRRLEGLANANQHYDRQTLASLDSSGRLPPVVSSQNSDYPPVPSRLGRSVFEGPCW